jgi:hypothetical protein
LKCEDSTSPTDNDSVPETIAFQDIDSSSVLQKVVSAMKKIGMMDVPSYIEFTPCRPPCHAENYFINHSRQEPSVMKLRILLIRDTASHRKRTLVDGYISRNVDGM